MKWYRVNTDFLSKDYDTIAREISTPAGDEKENAIELYEKELAKNQFCIDDKTKKARIQLVEYIYSEKLNRTRQNIIAQNY